MDNGPAETDEIASDDKATTARRSENQAQLVEFIDISANGYSNLFASTDATACSFAVAPQES